MRSNLFFNVNSFLFIFEYVLIKVLFSLPRRPSLKEQYAAAGSLSLACYYPLAVRTIPFLCFPRDLSSRMTLFSASLAILLIPGAFSSSDSSLSFK